MPLPFTLVHFHYVFVPIAYFFSVDDEIEDPEFLFDEDSDENGSESHVDVPDEHDDSFIDISSIREINRIGRIADKKCRRGQCSFLLSLYFSSV